MKKTLYLAALLCCLSSVISYAKKGVMYLKSPNSYQVISVSQNGQWACGVYYDENSDVSYGFRWNLTDGQIEMMGECSAMSVSNDGTVASSFYTSECFDDGKSREVAATWKDGKWTIFEQPASLVGAWAYAISPDGHYVTGTDNNYKSYIWKDGKIDSKIKITPVVSEANGTFITYAISPDGTMAGGWAYYSDDNRNPGYWDSKDGKFHCLEQNQPGSPWQAVKKFSADNKKVLFWGGYHVNPKEADKGYGIHAIYDIQTKDTTYIYPIEADPFNFDFFDMNGDGTIVTGYQQDSEGTELGIIWNNGTTHYAEEYLRGLGAEFSDDDMYTMADGTHYISRVMSLDAEGKTFAFVYYDQEFEYHTMIVAFDRELSNTPPVNLVASQVTGVRVAQLEWSEPLGDKSALKGYNIYRNGEKVNADVVTSTQYFDKEIEFGKTYAYAVSAVYDEGESEKTTVCEVTPVEVGISTPKDLIARQKGYNGSLIKWDAPGSNLLSCTYVDESKTMDAFGGNSVSFESATLFPAEQMSFYNGYRLAAVSFYPKTEQGSWIINIYTRENGVLTPLKTQKVDQSTLKFGEKNIIYFTTPLALQADHDLIVGIQTNVTNPSYDIQGVFEDCLKVGYTDLIRQVGDADFYSINEMSSTTYDMAWGTSAMLAPAGVTSDIDKLDHYEIYVDGADVTKSLLPEGVEKLTATEISTTAIAEGEHTVGVAAVFAGNQKSDVVTASLTVKANDNVFKVEPKITLDGSVVKATWETPKDDDATVMGYCGDTKAAKCPKATDDVTELTARIDFTTKELRPYEGYQIKSLSFMPLSNATFELDVYEDDTPVAAELVEEFKMGEWNTIELSNPVAIRKGCVYRYCIVCTDCPVGEAPLAIDTKDVANGYSSLISAGGEEGWYTVEEETSLAGNWMMRMKVADPEGKEFNVTSYDVYADALAKTTVTENEYTHDFKLVVPKLRTLRVDTNIDGKIYQGDVVYYNLVPTAVETVEAEENAVATEFYSLDGRRQSQPVKGVNIVRLSDGRVIKVVK